jgi:hypothetical protein
MQKNNRISKNLIFCLAPYLQITILQSYKLQ